MLRYNKEVKEFFSEALLLFFTGVLSLFITNDKVIDAFATQDMIAMFLSASIYIILLFLGHLLISKVGFIYHFKTKGIYTILSLGSITSVLFFLYTGANDVSSAWFLFSSVFLAMTIYGYVTKLSIYSGHAMLLMGLIGVGISNIAGNLLNYSGFMLLCSNVVSVVVPISLYAKTR